MFAACRKLKHNVLRCSICFFRCFFSPSPPPEQHNVKLQKCAKLKFVEIFNRINKLNLLKLLACVNIWWLLATHLINWFIQFNYSRWCSRMSFNHVYLGASQFERMWQHFFLMVNFSWMFREFFFLFVCFSFFFQNSPKPNRCCCWLYCGRWNVDERFVAVEVFVEPPMLEPTDDDLFDCIEKLLLPMILLPSELLLRSGSAVESSSKIK